ncbi:MAG: PRC-barrel domain-containing protein [Bryobacterales bacterium]
MLESARELMRYRVKALDGKLGKAHDFYFEDESWAIRYLLLNVGRWLLGERVLVPPERLGQPDTKSHCLPVLMTKSEVEHCASSETAKPISHQMQNRLSARYGNSYSQGGGPMASLHGVMSSEAVALAETEEPPPQQGPGLRSVQEVLGYQIEALDGPIGVAEDFLIDDDEWVIRYIVVNTKTWKPGRQVLIPPSWVQAVVWSESRIHASVKRDKVKTGQRFHAPSHANTPKPKQPLLWP